MISLHLEAINHSILIIKNKTFVLPILILFIRALITREHEIFVIGINDRMGR